MRAGRFDVNSLYKMARENVRPKYRRLRRMDADDWLSTIGLERRNVGADVAGAIGYALVGGLIGLGLGMILAPKAGSDLRHDIGERVREKADQFGVGKRPSTPTYAS